MSIYFYMGSIFLADFVITIIAAAAMLLVAAEAIKQKWKFYQLLDCLQFNQSILSWARVDAEFFLGKMWFPTI